MKTSRRQAQTAAAGQRRTAGAEPALDLRLALPGLLAWGALALLISRPTVIVAAAGVTCLALGMGAGWWWRRAVRPRPWAGVLALTLVSTGAVLWALVLHLALVRAGPLVEWAEQRTSSTVVMQVTSEPRVVVRDDERPPLVVLEARVVQVEARGKRAEPRTPVVVFTEAGAGWEEVRWHSRVEALGRWGPAEPGDRAMAVLTPRGSPTTVREPVVVLRGVDVVRERFREAMAPLPQDAQGLVPGLVIGDTSLTPPELTDAMRVTGMTHLSAVSGSNVTLVCGAVALVLARAGTPRRWRTPVVILALLGFILLCRPEPSVLRAGLMGTVGLLALTSGRRRASLPLLGTAIIGLLCLDPWLARSYGFTLSTLATLGLIFWARPWGLAMAHRLPRRLALLGHATAVPVASQVMCLPVIVLLQGAIPTWSVLANLLAAPLVAPTTVMGVMTAVLAPVSVALAQLVAWTAGVPAWLIGLVARTCARLPLAELDWVPGTSGAWLLAGLTLLALLTARWWRHQAIRRPWTVLTAAAAVVALLWPTEDLRAWPPPGWLVVGCDVGQGDAFVVRTAQGRGLVVDTGPEPAPVARCLRDLGIREVDLLVLTHFHADHVGGLPGVLDVAGVGTAYVSPVREPEGMSVRTLALLAQDGVPVHEVGTGDRVAVGEARVEVVAPGERPVAGGSAANNASIVLDVQLRETRILFTGDLEPEGARPVRQQIRGREYDVLKVAHHGSAAQDETKVRDTGAAVALIGVGEGNAFGHPAPSMLTLLEQMGAVVLRTDLHGDIGVSRDADDRLLVHRRSG